MTAYIERRLKRLEREIADVRLDIAKLLRLGRERVVALSRDELQAEQRTTLAEQRAEHAVAPFSGLRLRMLAGLERACDAVETMR